MSTEPDATPTAQALATTVWRAIEEQRSFDQRSVLVKDLTAEDSHAGVRLLAPVCARVGYQVPAYMAADFRRELKCSMGMMEKFFQEVAIERGIEKVATGAEAPNGQLLVILWPAERDGRAVIIPRLYELPCLIPNPDNRELYRAVSKLVH